MRRIMLPLLWLVLAVPPGAQGAEPQADQKTVFVNETQSFEPGYAVGNIAIGSANVADYKVMPGRRQLLIFGKHAGRTSLTIWDQNNVKRHEILITVMTREDAQVESDLRDLLKDFPSVQVKRLGSDLVVGGTVDNAQDLESVQKIANAARAKSIVRVASSRPAAPATAAAPATTAAPAAPGGSGAVPPTGATSPATAAKSAPAPSTGPATAAAPATTAAPAAPSGATGPAAPSRGTVTYDVELLEASSAFRTGSYGTGAQPSGPSLFKGEVSAAPGEEGTVFIPASAVLAKDPKKVPPGDVGIRVKVRPSAPDRGGAFNTLVLIETNLPVESANDTQVWRNSRWQFPVVEDVPFVIAGRDLLALPGGTGSGGRSGTSNQLGRAADTGSAVARLPGVSSAPEVGAGAGVVGTVRDLFGLWGPKKEPPPTQLVVVLRPRPGSPDGGKR